MESVINSSPIIARTVISQVKSWQRDLFSNAVTFCSSHSFFCYLLSDVLSQIDLLESVDPFKPLHNKSIPNNRFSRRITCPPAPWCDASAWSWHTDSAVAPLALRTCLTHLNALFLLGAFASVTHLSLLWMAPHGYTKYWKIKQILIWIL